MVERNNRASRDAQFEDFYKALLGDHVVQKPPSVPAEQKVDIDDEIARARKLKNDDAEQDIRLKRITLAILLGFLAAETVLIFVIALFQAIRWPFHFHLEEWSFKLVVAATIGQITAMLYVAVRYLFPKNK